MKKAFKMKQKYFSSFLKCFQLPKIVSDLRVEGAGADLLKRERGWGGGGGGLGWAGTFSISFFQGKIVLCI